MDQYTANGRAFAEYDRQNNIISQCPYPQGSQESGLWQSGYRQRMGELMHHLPALNNPGYPLQTVPAFQQGPIAQPYPTTHPNPSPTHFVVNNHIHQARSSSAGKIILVVIVVLVLLGFFGAAVEDEQRTAALSQTASIEAGERALFNSVSGKSMIEISTILDSNGWKLIAVGDCTHPSCVHVWTAPSGETYNVEYTNAF